MENTAWTEQWSAMQKMFLPTQEFSTTLRESARHFWENQEKILNAMQENADSWFERRREGTQAAREATERMYGAKTGTEAFTGLFQGYQTWASGALERMIADGFAWQKQIMALTGLASPPLAPLASENEGKPARSEAKTRGRSEVQA